MNIGKSIDIAIAKKGISKRELAKRMGMAPDQVSRLRNKTSCTGDMFDKLSEALNMPISEFIKLGEEL